MEALGYFDETDVAVIINQVLGCINYCHANGIAHRDLKPENILLADVNMNLDDLKIIDFGLAAVFDNAEEARFEDRVGSCYYIAPEILDGNYGPKVRIRISTLLPAFLPFGMCSHPYITPTVRRLEHRSNCIHPSLRRSSI